LGSKKAWMCEVIKKYAIFLINFYQNGISRFTLGSCRFYPTCSEYAVWQIKNNNFLIAIFAILARILRCNQFFSGGIDYPLIRKNFNSFFVFNRNLNLDIAFWFIPYRENKFYVVKKINFKKEKSC
jgi:hypothetical protein